MSNDIRSVFVPAPNLSVIFRVTYQGLLIALFWFLILLASGVDIRLCLLAFLFLGPFNPYMLYDLHIPYGIEYHESYLIVFYSFVFLRKRKSIPYQDVSVHHYKGNRFFGPRIVLVAKRSIGLFRKMTFSQTNNWSLSDQERIMSLAKDKGVSIESH